MQYDLTKLFLYWRCSRHLTEQETADKIGVDRTTYAQYESGVAVPPFKVVLNFADAFEIPLEKFFAPMYEN